MGRGNVSRPSPHVSPLGWVGMAFLVVGMADFGLTWFPLSFGDVQWEFGTVAASFDVLPVVLLGLALLLWSAMAADRRWLGRTVGAFALLLAAGLLAAALLYALTVPVALRGIPAEGPVALGIRKSIARTAVQSVIYPTVLTVVGVKALRHWRKGRA